MYGTLMFNSIFECKGTSQRCSQAFAGQRICLQLSWGLVRNFQHSAKTVQFQVFIQPSSDLVSCQNIETETIGFSYTVVFPKEHSYGIERNGSWDGILAMIINKVGYSFHSL